MAQRGKVLGALCPKHKRCQAPVARSAKGARCPLPEAQKVLGAFSPTLDTTSRSPAWRGALGRRGREADPDSRSASERGERAAGPESPREQGRRHLVVN